MNFPHEPQRVQKTKVQATWLYQWNVQQLRLENGTLERLHSNLTGLFYFISLVFNLYIHRMKYQKMLREDYHNQLTRFFLKNKKKKKPLKNEIEIEVSLPWKD